MTAPYLRAPKPEEWLEARLRYALNVVRAAELLGVDPSTWRGWETGRHRGPRYGYDHFLCRARHRRLPRVSDATLLEASA